MFAGIAEGEVMATGGATGTAITIAFLLLIGWCVRVHIVVPRYTHMLTPAEPLVMSVIRTDRSNTKLPCLSGLYNSCEGFQVACIDLVSIDRGTLEFTYSRTFATMTRSCSYFTLFSHVL